MESDAWPHRGWAGVHHRVRRSVGVAFPGRRPKSADHDAAAVDDDALIPPGVEGAAPDIPETFVGLAGWDIGTGRISHSLGPSGLPFYRETGSLPISDPGDVVVHPLESDAFEPARGSWRHVSQTVVSVNDDRFVSPEGGCGRGVEALEMNVDGPWDVPRAVFRFRQHIDELGTLVFDEPEKFCAVDVRYQLGASLVGVLVVSSGCCAELPMPPSSCPWAATKIRSTTTNSRR